MFRHVGAHVRRGGRRHCSQRETVRSSLFSVASVRVSLWSALSRFRAFFGSCWTFSATQAVSSQFLVLYERWRQLGSPRAVMEATPVSVFVIAVTGTITLTASIGVFRWSLLARGVSRLRVLDCRFHS